MFARTATESDLPALTTLLRRAFANDPVWGVALDASETPPEFLDAYWRLFLDGALPHDRLFTTVETTAVAVWIPPGEKEVTDDQERELRLLATRHLSESAARDLFALWERFDAHHPDTEPHAYLSLLATDPDHAGMGLGQRLLSECLSNFDESRVPTYLESSNPANNHRYERAGFRPIGGFSALRDDAWITTMWRPVGG